MAQEIIEDNLGHEPVIISNKQRKYDQPWIVEYIVENKNKNKTFSEIADGLKERGEESITAGEVSRLWKEALSRTVTITGTTAKAEFVDFTEDIKAIYGDVIKLMGEYVKRLRGLIDELDKLEAVNEEGKSNKLEIQMSIAKQIPLATGLMKEVREYVKNQISLFEIVQETKGQNLSVSDVLEQTNEYFPMMVKENLKQIREELGNTITVDQLDKYLKNKLK